MRKAKIIIAILSILSLLMVGTIAFLSRSETTVFVDTDTEDIQVEADSNSSNKYGIRWKTDDPNDLGERCFDAKYKKAKIGVGNKNGISDFDKIYPWSDIKRCNILNNEDGSKTVIYEGEDGFALDGSKGDVFVRIPKFCVEKYIEDGYEYRTVSATVGTVHSVFIENGTELQEIFIAAFEGAVDSSEKLRSISNVIPSNNISATDFLKYAKNNGNNYSLYDSRCVDAVWTLMAVEFGCRNSNRILGYGAADYLQPIEDEDFMSLKNENGTNSITINKIKSTSNRNEMPVGGYLTICRDKQTNILTQAKILSVEDSEDGESTVITFDGDPINIDTSCFVGSGPLVTNYTETCTVPLKWHTGRAAYIRGNYETTQNPIRYRWIENIFGNLWEFLPDVTFDNLQMYVCYDMLNYSIGSTTNGYNAVGEPMIQQSDNGNKSDIINSNYWITSLIDESVSKDIPFGNKYDTSLLSTQAFGAYYYLNDGLNIIANGGGFDHLYRCNMLTQRAWITPEQKWYLYGARLMYKDLQ